jgi:hypothetical protein
MVDDTEVIDFGDLIQSHKWSRRGQIGRRTLNPLPSSKIKMSGGWIPIESSLDSKLLVTIYGIDSVSTRD